VTHSITMLCDYAEYPYAECQILFIIVLSLWSVVMLNVVMLSDVLISVVAPNASIGNIRLWQNGLQLMNALA